MEQCAVRVHADVGCHAVPAIDEAPRDNAFEDPNVGWAVKCNIPVGSRWTDRRACRKAPGRQQQPPTDISKRPHSSPDHRTKSRLISSDVGQFFCEVGHFGSGRVGYGRLAHWKMRGSGRTFRGWRQLFNAIAVPNTDARKKSFWYRIRVTRSARSAGLRWSLGRKPPTFPSTNLSNVQTESRNDYPGAEEPSFVAASDDKPTDPHPEEREARLEGWPRAPLSVIPGRAKRELWGAIAPLRIHSHHREYGFRACAWRRIPE